MCVLFVALNQHPDYKLIVAANRDEFFARPTQASGFWADSPELLAGQDLQAGGTWMGLTTKGRFAALTNIRAPKTMDKDKLSRGHLVSNYLKGNENIEATIQRLRQTRHQYNGYNLLFGDADQLVAYNNFSDEYDVLKSDIYGLSNADIHTPWPKTLAGCEELAHICQSQAPAEPALLALLHNTQQADDVHLPDTGIPKDWERQLSARFIQGQSYGTRSCTLLLVSQTSQVIWREQQYGPDSEFLGERRYEFQIAT
ncbi:Transport and Golgi organization protein 2 like protein [Saliniradius amylolyticus]|uniref:Transport and Golgi organization protein 2 like protein n=1 Tax=Saliniradius amylolyticus TaxID=2183582 RepID=A0A2S2E1S6_9ALTE|nr:NRDE family protein [Saliniradius amylolyticus]AWL11601.1 Transport and Golgi organization protein 2 like protein [Saliniradius amylolyticus]